MSTLKYYCFGLINELFDWEDEETIVINDSLTLRKASDDEIGWFKDQIELFKSKRWINYFENEIFPVKDYISKKTRLKRNKWRYTVIEHTQFQLDDISKVSLKLSNLNLTPLLEISFELTGEHIIMITKDDFASYNLLSDCHSRHRQYGTKKYLRKTPDAQSIIDFHKTFKSVNELFISETDENSFIVKALTDFINIHMISDNSPFKLLSYISIIESLITYQPKNNADTIISKQLGQKVQFLYNNFMENLSFETYFKGANTNTISTIINKIYTYRNDIAHGNIPQMNKELKIIQLNEVNVIPFLDALLRKILRIAITNPNLIIDLKAC